MQQATTRTSRILGWSDFGLEKHQIIVTNIISSSPAKRQEPKRRQGPENRQPKRQRKRSPKRGPKVGYFPIRSRRRLRSQRRRIEMKGEKSVADCNVLLLRPKVRSQMRCKGTRRSERKRKQKQSRRKGSFFGSVPENGWRAGDPDRIKTRTRGATFTQLGS